MLEHARKRKGPPLDRAAYNSETWRQLRDYVFRRDAHICCNCSWPRARTVHHLTYSFGILCPSEFLVVLCTSCHLHRHELPAAIHFSIRDHYEVHKANKGFELLTQPAPGCRGEWVGKGRFRYWGRRGAPFCLTDPPFA